MDSGPGVLPTYNFTMILFLCLIVETTICKDIKTEFFTTGLDFPCLYNKTLKMEDCNNKNLDSLPTFHNDSTKIILSNNKLKTINCSFIWPKTTEYLDFSNNLIETFCFHDSLSSLKYLNLRGNAFNYSFPPGTFEPISKLEVLDIKNNAFYNILLCGTDNCSHALNSLACLQNVKNLSLDFNQFLFPKLEKLQMVDMSCDLSSDIQKVIFCNYHHCAKQLKSEMLENFTNVQYLTFSDCDLRGVNKGAFAAMKNLKYLNMSNNPRLTFNALENITHYMKNTSIEILDLSKLYCPFGPASNLCSQDLKGLQNTNLKQLYLDDNVLRTIDPHAFLYLPESLEWLSLRKNNLVIGLYILYTIHLKNLKVLDITRYFGAETSDLQIVTKECPEAYKPIACEYQQKISNITPIIKPSLFPLVLPHSLKVLKASNIELNLPLKKVEFNPNNSLETLVISSNLLTSWVGPLGPLNSLYFLDLSNNYCKNITNGFFKTMPSLKELHIQKNILGANVQDYWFKDLLNLEILNISSNLISDLPKNIFLNQHKMQILNISDNTLQTFNVNISHMKNLKLLLLSGNRMSNFTNEFIADLISIWNDNKTIKVDLRHNPLDCSCYSLETLKIFAKYKQMFMHFNDYRCLFTDKTSKTFKEIPSIILELKKQCTNYSIVLLISISFVSLFVAMLSCAIVYRYRWKIRYLYHIFRAKEKELKKSMDSEYQYHAFVSYASEQSAFVTKDMLHYLEGKKELKLCIHERDFVPGKDIATNIAFCVHNSRKVVFVLSHAFMNSYWCMYEFQMAKMEGIYARKSMKDILFLIIYEHIPSSFISLDLLNIINQQSYIEYPNEEQGNLVFWNKLGESLKM